MSLLIQQIEFKEALYGDHEEILELRPSKHLEIYRNNIRVNLTNALLGIYPLIHKIVGDEYFKFLARGYIAKYPSRSGNLHDYGEFFSEFLTEEVKRHQLLYLTEIAEYEWQVHKLYYASDFISSSAKNIDTISFNEPDGQPFILNPHIYLKKYQYPILRIIELCEEESDKIVHLDEGGVHLLILRRHFEIILISLTSAEFIFLNTLNEEHVFSQAFSNALQIDPEFSMKDKLSTWIEQQIFIIDHHQNNL